MSLSEICKGKHGESLQRRYALAGHCADFQSPSFARQAWNYAKSTAKHVFTGMRSSPQSEIDHRLSICNTCPHKTSDNRCSKCGCPVAAKASRLSESCPIGSWSASIESGLTEALVNTEANVSAGWAIGVTVSPRNVSTLHRCLSSLIGSGFIREQITVFADLDTDIDDYCSEFRVVHASKRLGAWRNFQRALFNTSHNFGKMAEFVMIVQDDVEFSRDIPQTVANNAWPSPLAGVLSLSTPRFYEQDEHRVPLQKRGSWWQVRDDNLAGAMALVFPGFVARQISKTVKYADWKRSRGGVPWEQIKNIDTWVGHAIRGIGRECWAQVPSIADHIADEKGQRVKSTVFANNYASGRREAIDFIGIGTSSASAAWLLDHQRFDLKTGLSHDELINVIIPFAGDCPDLAHSCLSALKSRAEINLRIIPVLNGVSRATRKALDAYRDQFHQWEMVLNKHNLGFTAAINQGLDHVERGDVLLLNSDAEIGMGCLREMLRVLRLTKKTASVGPMSNDDGHQSLKQARRRAQAGVSVIDPVHMPRRTSSEEQMIAWFCTLISAEALQEIGRPQGHHSGLAVDDEWSERARRAGWVNRLAHGAFCSHRHSETFNRLGQDRTQLQREAMRQWRS